MTGSVGGNRLRLWDSINMRSLVVFFLFSGLLIHSAIGFEISPQTKQVLVGTTSGWDSSNVSLTLYEKKFGKWKKVNSSWKARLGRSGLAWGRGLNPVPQGARAKKEGDWCAPAGVFKIGIGAWGYASSIRKNDNLQYVQITTRDMWYEDTSSPLYNQYRRLDHEPRTQAEKKAQMRQGDHAHSLKLFIAHNAAPNAIAGKGSSIFFHIWRGGGSKATAGCTAMSEGNLKNMIARIDPAKHPVYVLLPKAEYDRYRLAWKLP